MNQDRPLRGIKIRTLNYVLILAAVILYMFLLYVTVRISNQYRQLIAATEDYIACEASAGQVTHGSDVLTEQVRMFAATQDLQYLNGYFYEANVTRTRERALEYLQLNHADDASFSYLQTAIDNSNKLMDREIYAMTLISVANDYDLTKLPEEIQETQLTAADRRLTAEQQLEKGQGMVFDTAYQSAKQLIYDNINYSVQNILRDTRLDQATSQSDLHYSIERQRIYITILFIMNVLTFFMITILVIKPLRIYINCIRDDKALELIGSYEFKYLALTYNNIYEINAANNMMLRKKAEMDPLTGLMNRGVFQHLKQTLANHPLTMALVLVDVDEFKGINDRYGHEVGDKVLQRVARLLTNSFRPTDFVIRMGGDEFAVVMTDLSMDVRSAITRKIDRINQSLMRGEDMLPSVSLSVGVALSSQGFHEDLYRNADSALYDVKANGHCGCKIYEE